MLINALIRIAATAGTLLLLTQFVAGIHVDGVYAALIAALVWGILGLTVRPILGLLTLPINIITFGLFSFLLNALLFWFMSSILQGLTVAGFIPALIASVALALVGSVLHRVL